MDNRYLCVKMDEKLRVAVANELEKHSWTAEKFLNALYQHILDNGVPPKFIKRKSRMENDNLPPRRTFKNKQELLEYCDITEKDGKRKVRKGTK